MNELQNQVSAIAAVLSNPEQLAIWAAESENPDYSVMDYINDALDIEYIIGADGEYRGARVLVAFGGPNIWINTRTNTIEGSWWTDKASAGFDDAIGLDDTLAELYACR